MHLLDLFQGVGTSVGGWWNWIYFFRDCLVFSVINNSIEAVIWFNEEDQVLLKLHLPLEKEFPCRQINILKQISIQKFQHLHRGIYENKEVYFVTKT